VITALLLVGVLLGSVWGTDQAWPFAVLSLVLIAAAGWEWGRLNQAGPVSAMGLGVAVAAGGLAALWGGWGQQAPDLVWWCTVLLWSVGAVVALRGGPAMWPQLPRAGRWAVGVVGLWAAWLALTQARAIGINFMLSMLCLVWMADVAAYFGGRAFGRRKLAPAISPGKSWEGVWSGMAGVLLLALLWIALDRRFGFDGASLYTRLQHSLGWAGMAVALLGLAGFSVVGDLIESLVKRAAGAKDSSRLLPGHGGVLDRVDALLPVMPLALALATLGVG
ncbi:MAG: phosphatidate cytidylyltransferase, partial [Chitinophagaceae bacterium]|nr:phosphatidate cytidylyltransferase [Rubrivivax sp.]